MLLPDTIVYKWTQAISWFNGATPREMNRFPRGKILPKAVVAEFSSGQDDNSTDVVAQYTNFVQDEEGLDIGEIE